MSVHLKKRERVIKGGRNRAPRAKTFATEESAKAYADANGITNYTLKNLKCDSASTKKLRIVQA